MKNKLKKKFTLLLSFLILLSACSKMGENGETTGGNTEMMTTSPAANNDKEKLPFSETDINVSIYFSEPYYGETAYLKKFDMFSATWAWCNDFSGNPQLDTKNLGYIDDVATLLPEVIRSDLFMGHYGIGRDIGSTADKNGTTDEEYRLVRAVVEELMKNGLGAEFMYFASPVYTGGGIVGDAWKSVTDLEKWNELCYNIATYFKENNLNVVRHEIWNEPDYYITDPEKDGVYFKGTWQDYIDLYISGAKGVRKADSDALIGGVSAAWMQTISRNGELDAFLTQSLAEDILPDYVSWHFYGSNGGMKMLEEYISGARECLEKSGDYSTVQQHLNEFNISLDREVTKSYSFVRSLFSTYKRLLDATDITRVAWTSALDRELDDAQALIDPKTGERTPAFYAMWMYARLPVTPVKVENDSSRIDILASKGTSRAAFIAYDTYFESTEVTFDLSGVDFDVCDVKVYTIDPNDPQTRVTSNSPKMTAKYDNVDTEGLKYTVTVPKDGAVYVELSERDGELPAHERRSPLSENVVRTDYWYNGRADGGAFAWVSANSFNAVIGSGNSKDSVGTAAVVTLDGMKGKTLTFETVVSDNVKKISDSSMFGITVAYSVGGEYKSTVYYALNGVDGSTAIPLGTERAYDKMLPLGEGSGSYSIALADNAPEGWDGRIQLGFVVNDVEKSCGAEFTVNVE